jgi:hypothetical protein
MVGYSGDKTAANWWGFMSQFSRKKEAVLEEHLLERGRRGCRWKRETPAITLDTVDRRTPASG